MSYKQEKHPCRHENIHTIGEQQKETEHGKGLSRLILRDSKQARMLKGLDAPFVNLTVLDDVGGQSHDNSQC
jgi:hypothetical protein